MSIWADFYDEVMPLLPGDPLPALVDQSLRNAAIDFFDFCGSWVMDLGAVVTVPGTATYTFSESSETNVSWINKITTDFQEITETTATKLTERYGNWEIQTGTPVNYIQLSPDTVRLYPIPAEVFNLYANVALKPSRTAAGIPDAMFNSYFEEIKNGALSRLLKMPKKPWTDQGLAREYQQDFTKGKGDARVDAMRNFTTASLEVQSRAYGK